MTSISFENASYSDIRNQLQNVKSLWRDLNGIKCLEEVSLKASGNDKEVDNFQIFTPRFIVDDMIGLIGRDIVGDVSINILEPTSGDGAFTCRILEARLENDGGAEGVDAYVHLLKSLGTIYSIETDKNLIKEQRDNIYTIALAYLDKKKVTLTEDEDVVLRFVIVSNFLWAMTNSSTDVGGLFYEVAYKMPEAKKGIFKSLAFPVWRFDSLSASLHYEDPEVGA